MSVFYVGAPTPGWLAHVERPPLFVSINRLRTYKTWPRASGPWALDSGAFTELAKGHGKFGTPVEQYADEVMRAAEECGNLAWAAPQDMMCEPELVAAVGLGMGEHQRRTVANFVDLRSRLGRLVVPVLQGWEPRDYVRCAAMYAAEGVDLWDEPTIGVGSVCRRQGVGEATTVIRALSSEFGERLHGFGCKLSILRAVGPMLASADSMAWSFSARVERWRMDGCTHQNCANCWRWAYEWGRQVVAGKMESRRVEVAA